MKKQNRITQFSSTALRFQQGQVVFNRQTFPLLQLNLQSNIWEEVRDGVHEAEVVELQSVLPEPGDGLLEHILNADR